MKNTLFALVVLFAFPITATGLLVAYANAGSLAGGTSASGSLTGTVSTGSPSGGNTGSISIGTP